MHELSIAYNLVDVAEKAARQAGVVRVSSVHLRLGVFSGVEQDALQFSYEIATKDTLLADSQLIIETVPLIVHCPTCQHNVELDNIQCFQCPVCGTATTDIRQGKEIELAYLEAYDPEEETDETALA